MRSTRLLFSAAAMVALCAAACSSSSSGSLPNDNGNGDDAGNVEPGDDAGTQVLESGTGNEAGSGSQEAGTGGDASGDGGSLLVTNSCPDLNPANTTFQTAQTLTLDSSGMAAVQAGVVQSSNEWFGWMTPKSDPVHVYVDYTVSGAGNTSQLSLEDDDINDSYIANDDTSRTGDSQTLDTRFEATADGTFYSKITSNSSTCTTFTYFVDATYCTDPYEDNDTAPTATPVTFTTTAYAAPTTWATATASVSPTIDGFDDDYFVVTAPLSDPMTADVQYSVQAGDTTQLSIEVDDGSTNGYVDNDDTDRTTNGQTLSTIWEGVKNNTYVLHVKSNNRGVCDGYTASFNGLACTDNYEDNDTFGAAATLPDTSSTAATATISSLDDDYYVIPSPTANGSCSVAYTAAAGSTQQLSIEIDDVTNSYIDNDDTDRTGATQTLTASWTSGDAPYSLKVHASTNDCTTYTITCN